MRRFVSSVWIALPLAAAALTGCASDAGRAGLRGTVRPEPPPAQAVNAEAAGPDRHRQYFDQRRSRWYYFDPGRQSYFWENGEPRS